MSIDKDFVLFMSKAMAAAEKRGGTLAISEARPFLGRLYEEWKQTGKAFSAVTDWLLVRLEGTFVSLQEEPVWVEDESSWAFHDATPMVFVSQSEVGVAKAGVEPLSPSEVVYLFGVRVPEEGGFSVVYQTIVQFRDW